MNHKQIKVYRSFLLFLVFAMVLLEIAGCMVRHNNGQSPANPKTNNGIHNSSSSNTGTINGLRSGNSLSAGNGLNQMVVDNALLPIVNVKGVNYVQAEQLADTLQYQSHWDAHNASYRIGDNDVAFEFKMNSKTASREGDFIQTADAPIIYKQKAYLPLTTLYDLFQEEMNFDIRENQLIIHGTTKNAGLTRDSYTTLESTILAPELQFKDDPDDPSRATTTMGRSDEGIEQDNLHPSLTAVANINMPGLIQKARQYLGVGYAFGAGPYAQTGKFDCSSFIQYVFGQYNVSLPRTARAQAKSGFTVSRNNLRAGDLMFFYTPSKFRSNSEVGHVGIYIGNNQMINAGTVPIQGVQITNINTAFWKRTYLFAKRVAQ